MSWVESLLTDFVKRVLSTLFVQKRQDTAIWWKKFLTGELDDFYSSPNVTTLIS
jgi:hypothetical protein